MLAQFIKQEEGAIMAEYGLLTFFIAIIAIAGVVLFGLSVANLFTDGDVASYL
jgi:Flp pilus assembly pilin Flp